MEDARRQPRAQLILTPEYLGPADMDFVHSRTHDVSIGGMFIEAERPIASGTLIKVRCEPTAEGVIEGVAKVVWNRPSGAASGPPGMGIKFIRLKGDSERVLRRLIEANAEAIARGEIPQPMARREPEPAAAVGPDQGDAEGDAATGQAAQLNSEPIEERPKRTSHRPSAANLAARLSSAPPPAEPSQTAQESAAVEAEAASTAQPASAPATRQPAAPLRGSEPVATPRQAGPAVLVLGGLALAIAVLAVWLLAR